MWLYIVLLAWSTGFKSASDDVVPFLILAAPGLVVVIGSCIQSIFNKLWALVLVFVGGVLTLFVTVPRAYFFFGYTGNVWGLRVVFADVFLLVVTATTSLIVVFLHRRGVFQPTVSNKSLDASGGGVFRN